MADDLLDANGAGRTTPLHDAAWEGDAEAGRLLLEAGADVNAADMSRWTPLHLAVQRDHAELARLLLQAGAAEGAIQREGNR